MTDRTKKYLAISRAVKAHYLVEIDARTGSGKTKKIRAIYKGRSQQIKGQWYFDILDAQSGIGRNTSNAPPTGGLALQENVSVHAIAKLDQYSFTGQTMLTSLYIPHTGDVSVIFTGTIFRAERTSQGVVFHAAINTLGDIPAFPTEKITFGNYPNAPLLNIGLPAPVVIGKMDTQASSPERPDSAYLAPLMHVDALNRKFIASTTQIKNLGAAQLFNPVEQTYLPVPYTKSGVVIQLGTGGATVALPAPLKSTSVNHVVYQNRVYPDGAYQYISPPNPDLTLTAVRIMLRPQLDSSDIDGTLPQPPRIFGRRVTVQMRYKVDRGEAFTHPRSVDLYQNGFVSQALPIVVQYNPNDTSNLYIRYFFSGNYYGATVHLGADVTYIYENPLAGRTTFPDMYIAASGYTDRAAQYADGSAVRQEGSLLTNPVDVIVALLRDKQIGVRAKSSNVTGDVGKIRTSLGAARLDGQFGGNRPLSVEKMKTLLRSFGITLRRSGDQYQISHTTSAPTALLSEQDIIRIGTELSPISEIAQTFVLSYRYSHALGRHTRHLIRDPHYTVATTGRVRGNTLTLSGNLSSILIGDRIHVEGSGISTTRTVKRKQGAAVEVDGNAMPTTDPVQVWSGPHFDYACYLSSQEYGYQTQERAIELDIVADDATARGIMAREVAYYTRQKYRPKLQCPLGAVRIMGGDRISIDHRELPAPIQARLVAHYAGGLPYAAGPATGLSFLTGESAAATAQGTTYAKSASAVEVMRVGSQYARGSMHTLRQSWPPASEVWYQPHIFTVTRWSVNPETDTITLHTETEAP